MMTEVHAAPRVRDTTTDGSSEASVSKKARVADKKQKDKKRMKRL